MLLFIGNGQKVKEMYEYFGSETNTEFSFNANHGQVSYKAKIDCFAKVN